MDEEIELEEIGIKKKVKIILFAALLIDHYV